jgi:hypothetical protein
MGLVKVKVNVALKDRHSGQRYGDTFETMIAEQALWNASTPSGRAQMTGMAAPYYPGCDVEVVSVTRIYD